MLTIQQLIETACHAARKAGYAIMEMYGAGSLNVEMKEAGFPFTGADKASHEVLTKELASTNIPIVSEESMQIVYSERQTWPVLWLIDPLDGTKEFINQNGEFTINIGLIVHNQPAAGIIYMPYYDTMYYGSQQTGAFKMENSKTIKLRPRKQRMTFGRLLEMPFVTIVASRSHMSAPTKAFITQFKRSKLEQRGSALKFMLLAEHQADIYPRLSPTMEWDTAAAHAILNVLGCGIYQADMRTEVTYNKAQLQNPDFIAF